MSIRHIKEKIKEGVVSLHTIPRPRLVQMYQEATGADKDVIGDFLMYGEGA